MRALLSLGLDLLEWIGIIADTTYAILLEHPIPVALALVALVVWAWHSLACALEHPNDRVTVTTTSSKIVWTNPPHGPYPNRSFSGPAVKGFRSGYVDDRHIHRVARSIVHPDEAA